MVVENAPERIEVSLEGMRELHIGRHPAELIKELVQNAFDEDSASACSVKITYIAGEGTLVVVRDNGAGFANIKDVWTLLGTNPKRRLVNKRGRFNSGDKEVLAVAIWAKVETAGFTIEFPEAGGRTSRKNKRKSGTVFSVMMPWDGAQADELIERLSLIRPPQEYNYSVNGMKVSYPPPLAEQVATLETVLQDGPGEPMRKTSRKTTLLISQPASPDGTAYIYEMGIPIQPIETPYDIDVQQKVPMPPNRDTVRESFLQDIYAEVLNATHDLLDPSEFGETWVRTGASNNRLTETAAKSTVRSRYGDKVVIWSPDKSANMDAIDQGFEVIHPRTMSRDERQQLREKGGLKSSHVMFGDDRNKPVTEIDISNDPVKQAFAAWVVELGEKVGMDVETMFINKPNARMLADCTMNTENPLMRFNVFYLDDDFFKGRDITQLRLIIHELGHATLNGEVEHGRQWGNGCAIVGARLSMALSMSLVDTQLVLCGL